MTKKEVVWLITKLFGVLFAYWTVVAVFVLIGSVYAYIQLPSPPRFGKDNSASNVSVVSPGMPVNPTLNPTPMIIAPAGESAAETLKNAALKQLLWDLFLVVIYGLIAWYLIRDGRFLFALLNREAPYDESGKPIEQDSFPLAKKKEDVVTTLNLSDIKKEETPPSESSDN